MLMMIIYKNIEKCILSVCEKHKIEKEKLLDYIELEVREQLKQTIEGKETMLNN